MLSYIRIFIWQFRSHTFFTLIKVTSLAIGFSVFLVLFALIGNDLRYDNCWSGEDQLYRISLEQYQDGQLSFRSARSYRGLPGMLVEEFPEVTGMTRLLPDVITVFVGGQQIQDVRMFYADTNIFKILPLDILAAESSEVFPDIHSMAISASLARILYGTVDCLGEELRLNEGWTFFISTVFEDIPEKSHLAFDVLLTRASLVYYMQNFDNMTSRLVENDEFEYVDPGPYHRSSWNNYRSYNYVRIKAGTDLDQLREKARKLIEKVELPNQIKEATILPFFQNIEDIHLESDYPDEIKENSSMFYIYMLLLIGLVVLVISWINFMNLYAVVFNERTRVNAIRMVHGAGSHSIMSESFAWGCMISLMAAAITVGAAFVVEELSPAFVLEITLLPILLILIIITALVSMLVPATSYRPGRIINQLKGEVFGNRRGSTYRRIMVAVQFSSGIVLIACTLVIFLQMKYTRKKELGFNDSNIIYSFSPMTMNQRPDIPARLLMFRNEMSSIPGVDAFSVSSTVPGQPVHFPGVTISHMKEGSSSEAFVQQINVDHFYLDLYGINLIGGTGFRENEQYDIQDIVLNRKATEELGFDDPAKAIGEMIQIGRNSWKVIGVIENYHHFSLKDKLLPIVFFKSIRWRASVGCYSFRLASLDPHIMERIGAVWNRIYPGEQFLYSFMEESYQEQYKAESSFGSSFLIAALLAIITSCLGLLGLSRFNILKRTKEIGIRKTFGSGRGGVLRLLQIESFILVLISSMVGVPVAWYIANRWLMNFSYRIDLSWWMFLMAVLATLFVSVATTLVQTWRAVNQNPVETLRYE